MRSPQVHGEGLAFPQVMWDHGTVRFHEGPCPTSDRAPQSLRLRKLCRAQTAGSWLSWLSWLLTAWKASSASGSWCISTWKLVSHIPRNVFHLSYDSSIYFQLDFSATRIPSEQMAPPLLVPSCMKYRAPSHPSPHQAALKTSEISNSFHACKLSKAQKRWNENKITIYKPLGNMCSLKLISILNIHRKKKKNTQKKLALRKRIRLSAITNTVRIARVSQLGGFAVACLWLNFSRSIVRSWSWRNLPSTQEIWRRGIKWYPLQQCRNPHVVLWRGLLVFCSKQLGRRTECIAQTLRHHHAETHLCIRGADDWDYGTWSHVSCTHCFANDPPHLLVPHRRGPLLWCPQDTQHEGCILLQWNQSTSMFQIVKNVNVMKDWKWPFKHVSIHFGLKTLQRSISWCANVLTKKHFSASKIPRAVEEPWMSRHKFLLSCMTCHCFKRSIRSFRR